MNKLYEIDSQGQCWVSEQGIIELAYQDLLMDSMFEWQDTKSKNNYIHSCETQDNWPWQPKSMHTQDRSWFTPPEYQALDLRSYVLQRCHTPAQIRRAEQELCMIEKLNVTHIFQHLIYLVDTWRSQNLVWGIGRGSSVSCFVLYAIGLNKINPLDYDLDPEEFFKTPMNTQ